MSNPIFAELLINEISRTEETSVILFAAYSLKIMPRDILNEDLVTNVESVFKNHVESEVNNALNYEFRLNRDLMNINDTEEEGLLFEIPDKSLIEAHHKEEILKSWVSRELELIKEAEASI